MTKDFDVDVKADYVQLTFHGEFESDVLLELWPEIFEAAKNNDRTAVLVDIRDMTGTPPGTFERYEHGTTVADLQWGIGAGIALAVIGNEPIVDPDRFAEVVGANRGAFAKVFTETDETEEWITRAAVQPWARG